MWWWLWRGGETREKKDLPAAQHTKTERWNKKWSDDRCNAEAYTSEVDFVRSHH